ncbi:uncharacterized protein LOC129314227 [Prosopis cineraria]|uniref:uncharacterized protein LOC129314227 n=1 Tax=Prosopis cineraria TaxID=364024 RepID=UPI0024100C06|nr:uncharacterized protein LOC129313344 isoform X1 [Prosopis cineraria]XP_054813565.1 uncharacterized protein LOC129314227 [Prosopis cineraria]
MGVAICLFLKSLSQLQILKIQSYIVWKFQDHCHANKTKMHGMLKTDDDWGVYVGFYPFKHCQPHLNFTLSVLTTNTARNLHDVAIMGCRWRLASKHDFDKWSEDRAPSPSGHASHNDWERGESSNSVTKRKGEGRYQEIQEIRERNNGIANEKGKRKYPEIESTRRNYSLRSQKALRRR